MDSGRLEINVKSKSSNLSYALWSRGVILLHFLISISMSITPLK